MPRPMFPWLAPPAPSTPPPAPVQEPANRWIAPTPEVVVARPKTNVRDTAHAARTSRKPRGGDRHAVKEPVTPAVKSEPPAPEPTTEEEGTSGTKDPDSNQGRDESRAAAGDVSSAATTYSPEEVEAAVDELLEPAAVVEVFERPRLTNALLAVLAKTEADRGDLIFDQTLPPAFKVVDRKGNVLATFNGVEHAVHANRKIGGAGVVRLADGKLMTGRES